MRILIIGGTRFIGPYVVSRLIEMGHEILLFNRGITVSSLNHDVDCIQGDRANLVDFAESLRKFAPHVVLDMIPVSERDAIDVMNLMKGVAKRIVGISSQDVYRAYGVLIGIESGGLSTIPLEEASPLRTSLFPYRDQVDSDHRLYHYEKILVERVLMGSSDIPGTILRLPMVYGPGDYQHRLFPYLKRIDDGRNAIILEKGLSAWRWSRSYVEDVANAIVLAVTKQEAEGRVYNVAEKDALSEEEWVRAIGAVTGWNGEIVMVPEEKLPNHMRSNIRAEQDLVVETMRIRKELGYSEVVDRHEAIKRTIAWERANPPEQVEPNLFDYDTEDRILRDAGFSY